MSPVSFSKIFLSFSLSLSLSVHSPVSAEIYISAEIDRKGPKLYRIGFKVKQVVLPLRIASWYEIYISSNNQTEITIEAQFKTLKKICQKKKFKKKEKKKKGVINFLEAYSYIEII